MPDFDVTVEGVELLDMKLRKAVSQLAPEKIEAVLLPIAKSFADKLRSVLPLGPTGNLRKGVYAHTPKRGASRPLPAASAGVSGRVAPHLHLVEYGTKARYTDSGAYRGTMPKGYYFTNLKQREEPGMARDAISAVKALVDEGLGDA